MPNSVKVCAFTQATLFVFDAESCLVLASIVDKESAFAGFNCRSMDELHHVVLWFVFEFASLANYTPSEIPYAIAAHECRCS
jgi:hypothetical protein